MFLSFYLFGHLCHITLLFCFSLWEYIKTIKKRRAKKKEDTQAFLSVYVNSIYNYCVDNSSSYLHRRTHDMKLERMSSYHTAVESVGLLLFHFFVSFFCSCFCLVVASLLFSQLVIMYYIAVSAWEYLLETKEIEFFVFA